MIIIMQAIQPYLDINHPLKAVKDVGIIIHNLTILFVRRYHLQVAFLGERSSEKKKSGGFV